MIASLGCGSGSAAKAGPISVSALSGTSLGTPKSLVIGEKVQVGMTPSNDPNAAGVDWTVFCGGSPITGSTSGGACGTFAPTHTADGAASIYTAPTTVPIGGTVTITATVTGDPSATSSVMLSINVPPRAISFSPMPPAELGVGAATTVTVEVSNDVTGAGASFSAACGDATAGACGSFGAPAITLAGTTTTTSATYTAPSVVPPAPVTIMAASAADASVSIVTTITIEPPPPPIGVTLSPATLSVGESRTGIAETANLIAVVTSDSTNAGVNWTANCNNPIGGCGTFTPANTASGAAVLYKAPSSVPTGGTVTITATAAADSTATANATATILAAPTISVTLTAGSPTVATLDSTTLSATVTGDASQLGVDWTVSCASSNSVACGAVAPAFSPASSTGTYTVTATYTAPASPPPGGTVTIAATPQVTLGNNPAAGNPGLAGIAIVNPPSVSFLQQPPATLTAGGQAPVSAVVANDISPGGITWTTQCSSTAPGGCGYVEPWHTADGNTATYTAPPAPPPGPVTIVAASSSYPGVSAASSAVTIAPATALSVNFVPAPPSQLQQGVSVNLEASVANDTSGAGVDWQVCPNGCGFFTIVPEIPPPPQTPNLPPTPPVTVTRVQGWPSGRPILYTAPASNTTVVVTATATASDQSANPIAAAASVAITDSGTGPALAGVVQAGLQPVSGAHVALYAAGTSGYGSASTLVYAPGTNPYALTGKDGKFTLPSGYGCPTVESQMYLLVIGGSAGTNPPNPNLALMAALGPCGALSSSPAVVNEVTTIATAWALAPFAANPLKTGKTSYLNIGSSSGNAAGLANGFATVNNLINVATGQAVAVVPGGNALAPYTEIDTLADILNACTATAGGVAGDGSPCGNLFVDANPYRNVTGTEYTGVPTDTLQAAFEIAQNPDYSGTGVSNVDAVIDGGALFAMASPASPFQPTLTTLPYDYSISLNFTGGGGRSSGSSAGYFAIDGSGDLWISNTAASTVTEWDNQGAAITPAPGYSTSTLVQPGPLAIDSAGDVWICGQNGLTELNFIGSEMPGSPFGGGGLVTTGCLNMAIDGIGNIWTGNPNSVSKFDDLGDALSPASGYTIPVSPSDPLTVSLETPLAIDAANNVWVGVDSPTYPNNLSLAELTNSGGLPNFLSPDTFGTTTPSNFVDTTGFPGQAQIAVDRSGNVWVPATQSTCVPGTLAKIPAYAGIGTTDQASSAFTYSGGSDPFRCSGGVAVDGAGVIWAASAGGAAQGAGGAPLTPGNIGAFNPALPADIFGYASPSLASGTVSLAVDGSGNVWVLLEDGTMTEFVGIATPAVTPLSVALKNGKLGAEP